MKVNFKKISVLQAKKELSTRELSKLSNISESAICKIKKGIREPQEKTVGKIARALDVEVMELIQE